MDCILEDVSSCDKVRARRMGSVQFTRKMPPLDGIGMGYVAVSSQIAVALSIVNTGTISDVLHRQLLPGCGTSTVPASCRSHGAKVVWHAPYVACQTKQGALSNGKKQSTEARRTSSEGRIQQDEAQGI
jgi:hypothetical protein